jgi:leucyl/phenylalanyl-tRNA---protein transferase
VEALTPEFLLSAYANGFFPMAESRNAEELRWYHPEMRGIIPLDKFHIPASMAKFLKKNPFEVTRDKAFRGVITACAARQETWINNQIIDLYCTLHDMGFAHSVECWKKAQGALELVGGLYGVALGGAFFGESMFSTETNASKVALAHLVQHLKDNGFTLLDTQYVNDHLKQFGVIEITRDDYLERLQRALTITPASFSLE